MKIIVPILTVAGCIAVWVYIAYMLAGFIGRWIRESGED